MTELIINLGLDNSLAAALRAEEITAPTDIQKRVVPELLLNKDVVFQSPTATGKTLAYLLPLFEKLKESPQGTNTIILAPTHELVIQIHRQIERLAQNSGISVKSTPLIGGSNIHRQIDKLKKQPQILVGSPGRILELIEKKKIKSQKIKVIIMDEIDQLLDMNNSPFVLKILKRLPREKQFIASSATLPDTITKIIGTISSDYTLIKSEEGESIPKSISHSYLLVEQRDKIQTVRKLINSIKPTKALIFLNNVELIDNLISKLEFHGIKAQDLHGVNQKLDRKKVMGDFRSEKLKILVASDIAARGLQMDEITHIFNMDIPEKSKEYLHRAGRTGRNGREGAVISLSTVREASFLKKIERELEIRIEKR
jgi:superfamily II DNA/RNA helicase